MPNTPDWKVEYRSMFAAYANGERYKDEAFFGAFDSFISDLLIKERSKMAEEFEKIADDATRHIDCTDPSDCVYTDIRAKLQAGINYFKI